MNETATQPLTIQAEPIDAQRCRYVVDRPITQDRWVYFKDPEEAQGSILAERLFEIDGVSTVLVAHHRLIVTRKRVEPKSGIGKAVSGLRRFLGDPESSQASWQSLAAQVGQVLRTSLESPQPVVAEGAFARMPGSAELRRRVQQVLDETVNPVVAGHGGGVSIHDVIDNILYVRMSGGCQGCGLADNTLKHGVEAAVREAVPEIFDIIDLTDHAAGQAPWRRR